MGHPPRPTKRGFQHPLGLERVRPVGGLAGDEIPQRPCGHVQQRIGVQRGHVEVVGVPEVHRCHGFRVRVRPGAEIVRRFWAGVALRDRVDQVPLDVGRRRRELQRPLRRLVGAPQRGVQIRVVKRIPLLVVVGAGRVRDAPVRQREPIVGGDGGLEASDRLLVVERIAPDQPPIKPTPRLDRQRRCAPAERPEVERVRGR